MNLHFLDWQFVGKFLEDGLALFHAYLVRFPYEFIFSLIYISEIAFESVNQVVSNKLEFLVLVVSILILGQNDDLSAKIRKRGYFLSLQLRDVVGHLVPFGVKCVFLHRFDDASIVAHGKPIFFPVLREFGVDVDGFSLYLQLYFIFETLYLHYLPFQIGVFLHVVSVYSVQFGLDGDL